MVGSICECHNDIVCFLPMMAFIAIHDGWSKELSNVCVVLSVEQRRMFVVVNCFAIWDELFVV